MPIDFFSGRLRAAVLLLALLPLGSCGPQRHAPAPAPAAARDVPAAGVVPLPAAITVSPADSFTLGPGVTITFPAGDGEAERIGRHLAGLIGTSVDTVPPPVIPGDPAAGGIHLAVAPGTAPGGDEGYELVVRPEGVVLRANHDAGLFHGIQTLRQLLPAAVEYEAALPRPLRVPAVRIADAPRFPWRGAMLDVARHFLEPDDVKRYIDLMALYKLNRLHLHLSDDQGWRIEIRSWPDLARHGGSTEVGGGPGGFYTQEEYADLVAYAADRFITIVPEIDMPGHTNAALASYAELNCDGLARPLYTGIRVGFSALCPEAEATWRFVDDVVREISALTPGPYFHLGGDEVEKLTDPQYRAFVERAEGIVRSHGKRMIGWGEIAPANLHPTTIVQHWRPSEEALVRVAQAAARGAQVILSPADRVYLDMKYDTTTALGLAWAGYVGVRTAYDWDPAEMLPDVPAGALLGVEAPLWSETVADLNDAEWLAFPRLAAVAEVGWSPARARDWDGFSRRLGAQAPRWAALGVNYYRSPEVPWRD